MAAIRTATNKAWVLGNDRFIAKKMLNRQMQKNHAVGIGGLKYLRVNRVSIESDPICFFYWFFYWFLVSCLLSK